MAVPIHSVHLTEVFQKPLCASNSALCRLLSVVNELAS